MVELGKKQFCSFVKVWVILLPHIRTNFNIFFFFCEMERSALEVHLPGL